MRALSGEGKVWHVIVFVIHWCSLADASDARAVYAFAWLQVSLTWGALGAMCTAQITQICHSTGAIFIADNHFALTC